MSSAKSVTVTSLLTVLGVAVVIGAVYIWNRIQDSERAADALLHSAELGVRSGAGRPAEVVAAELASAKINLQTQVARLNELRRSSAAESSFQVALRQEYGTAEEILARTDVLLKSSAIQSSINAQRQAINNTLNSWKALSVSSNQNSSTVAAAQSYASTVQNYIAQLQSVVNNLTPTNSGLTQTQINNYQTTVNQAANEIAGSVSNLSNTSTNSNTSANTNTSASTNTSNTTNQTSPATQQEIQLQTTLVNQAQTQVNALEQELAQVTGSSSSNQTGGSDSITTIITVPVIPLLETATSGKPRLIQGTNYEY
jgi:uncharacterized protein YukE